MTATPPYECHWSLPSFRLDCLTILSPSHVLLRTISQPLCVCGLTKYYPKCHKFLMGYYRSPFFLFSPLHFYINLPHSSAVFLLARLYHALHTIRAHSKCVLSGLVFWYVGRQGLFLSFCSIISENFVFLSNYLLQAFKGQVMDFSFIVFLKGFFSGKVK